MARLNTVVNKMLIKYHVEMKFVSLVIKKKSKKTIPKIEKKIKLLMKPVKNNRLKALLYRFSMSWLLFISDITTHLPVLVFWVGF